MAFIARWQTAEIAYAFSPGFTAGLTGIAYAGGDTGSMFFAARRGSALGVNAAWLLGPRDQKSWYLGGHILRETFISHSHAAREEEDQNGWSLDAVFGRRIPLGSRLFLMLGAGGKQFAGTSIAENQTTKTKSESSGKSYVMPHFEAKLGLCF